MERQDTDSLTEGDGWRGVEEISEGFEAIKIPQQLLHAPVAEITDPPLI